MSLFSGLPAILTTKAAAAAAGIGIATVAAGTAAATLSTGSHAGSNTPVTAGATNGNGSNDSNGGSTNGRAADASPSGAHGSAVVHAVQTCTPGPTFGQCVANVASGGRSSAQGSDVNAPPSPLPTAPVDHPTGQPSVPGAVGPPNPLPTAPVSPPGGRP